MIFQLLTKRLGKNPKKSFFLIFSPCPTTLMFDSGAIYSCVISNMPYTEESYFCVCSLSHCMALPTSVAALCWLPFVTGSKHNVIFSRCDRQHAKHKYKLQDIFAQEEISLAVNTGTGHRELINGESKLNL